MSITRTALRESVRFEASLVTPVVGLVTALPVVAVFAIGLAFFNPLEAISLAVGANLIAVVSLVGAPRLSLSLALVDASAMAIAVVLGVATTSMTWLHVVVLVPLCFAAGLVTVLGITQGVIGTQAIIAYVVLGRFAGSFLTALHLGLLVLIGALVEVGALIVLRLPSSLRFQRYQLAAACDAVAELARSNPRRSATEILSSVDAAERALAAPSLFGRDDSRVLLSVLNQLRRLRLELTTMAGLRVRLAHRGPDILNNRLDRSTDTVATTLDKLATALRRRSTSGWREATTAYPAILDALERELPDGADEIAVLARQVAAHLRAIDGQLRTMGNLIEELGEADTRHAWRTRLPTLARLSPQEHTDLSLIRGSFQLDAPALRHGVRLAVAVPASVLLAAWWALPRGYWVPFAVAVILKPDYSTMVRRGADRIVGSAVGASLAAVLVTWLHPENGVAVVLVGVIAWAAYATWSASFPVAIGLITALVLILLGVAQSNPISTALDRLIDVAVGGAIAMLAYVVWPTSPRAGVTDAFAHLFSTLETYLDAVAPAVQGAASDPSAAVKASRAGRIAWARAEAAVGRSVEEPSSTRVNPNQGRALLAVSMRILRAIHALRIEAERGATAHSSPELVSLINACHLSLDAVALHFTNGAARRWEDLRPIYRDAETQLAASGSAPSVAVHFDELVNALNTAAHLLSTPATDRV